MREDRTADVFAAPQKNTLLAKAAQRSVAELRRTLMSSTPSRYLANDRL